MNRRISLLIALISGLTGGAFAQNFHCSRDCDVWRESGTRATRACRLKQGTPLKSVERLTETVVRIETEHCRGLMRIECVNSRRKTASAPAADPAEDHADANAWRMLIEGQADALTSAVAYSSTASSGLGFGGTLSLEAPLSEVLRLRGGLGYQSLQLKQTYDASGALEDSNPAQFSQNRGFLAASLLLGYVFNAVDSGFSKEVRWSVEAGAEYDHPLSASQTTSDEDEVTFTPKDKLVLLTGGVRGSVPLGSGYGVDGFARFYYNVGSTGGTSLHAFRFGAALFFDL